MTEAYNRLPDKNRAYLMDAIEFLKMLPDKSVDLVIADPPYYRTKGPFDFSFDTEEAYLSWCREWAGECCRILKDTGAFYCWSISSMLDRLSIQVFSDFSWIKRNLIVWNYHTGRPGKQIYRDETEFLWFYSKAGHLLNVEDIRIPYAVSHAQDKRKNPRGKSCGTVWECPRIMPNYAEHTGHPTQKPLTLCERMIKASSKPGDTVMIPFAGSGSEAVACLRLDRYFYATENHADYYRDILLPRLEGEKQVLQT